ncbi:MAG: DsbE family thiol:disulfide interchange protein [Zoogloeaceae bacterium]|jgi:cytochrome c biogenesis protein CcmG/thiol:disulfide interchange protein DsbE|nr:DsbE family thiol:disulfide interchange protein [Zoogloeaceae bacterium]
MNRFLLPLGLFIVLAVFLAIGLNRDPREVPSPLVGKPAPDFVVPQVDTGKNFSPKDMLGQVWLLNVWSTWCVTCRIEHPLLVAAAKKGGLPPVVGLSYKEVRGDMNADASELPPDGELALARQRAANWLARHGDPYLLSALDVDGRVGIDYGVYGVPETYLIDKTGTIRYKQIGAITAESLEKTILPLAKELEK